jgi:(p)ppGpp synthase/HD superfamily hydrolase
MKTQVSTVTARVKRDNALIALTAQISDLEHLHTLLRKFSNLKDVKAVYRVTKREARVSSPS